VSVAARVGSVIHRLILFFMRSCRPGWPRFHAHPRAADMREKRCVIARPRISESELAAMPACLRSSCSPPWMRVKIAASLDGKTALKNKISR